MCFVPRDRPSQKITIRYDGAARVSWSMAEFLIIPADLPYRSQSAGRRDTGTPAERAASSAHESTPLAQPWIRQSPARNDFRITSMTNSLKGKSRLPYASTTRFTGPPRRVQLRRAFLGGLGIDGLGRRHAVICGQLHRRVGVHRGPGETNGDRTDASIAIIVVRNVDDRIGGRAYCQRPEHVRVAFGEG